MKRAGEIMKDKSGGRSTPKQEVKQAKIDRMLDLLVVKKLSLKDLRDAFKVLEAIELGYRVGGFEAAAKKMADAQHNVASVGKELAKRWESKKKA